MEDRIIVDAHVDAPIEQVWQAYTDPEAIKAWNQPSPDWHTVRAENDLREGGRFLSRMEAKDGSAGFDFAGMYDEVVEHDRIAYTMDDGRKALVSFAPMDGGAHVTVSFDPEHENLPEFQRQGWQAILDSFKRHVEAA